MAEEVFQVLPAVDLLGEEVVRLEQGDFVRVAVRARPDEVLRRFAAAGARLSAPGPVAIYTLTGLAPVVA